MSTAPAREVVIDDELVAALLRTQHPDLAELPRRVVAEGWDNVILRLGDALALRLPRRAVAADLVRHEQQWLPVLSPRLPLAVPTPVRTGVPQAGYAWHWSVTRWLPGARAADRPRRRAAAWAGDLAVAFAALHSPAPPAAPHNPVRAVPLATRAEAMTARFERARAGAGALSADEIGRAAALWRRGAEAPAFAGPPAWVHGDPHPANLLVSPGPTADSLVALLDFGDLSAGDPACDLATAWLTFDGPGRAAFVETYERLRPGDRDVGRWERAVAWAVAMSTSVLVDAPADAANGPWARAALAELLGGAA